MDSSTQFKQIDGRSILVSPVVKGKVSYSLLTWILDVKINRLYRQSFKKPAINEYAQGRKCFT